MNDKCQIMEQCSPKSLPRDARMPIFSCQDSTGTLKTTISLGKTPSIIHKGPFFFLKELPPSSELTGAVNLMSCYGLEHTYNKFNGKKLKRQLSSFLPNLPGIIDTPGLEDNSSLRSVVEKPPVGGKQILLLPSAQLAAFRLHPGPLPEKYRTDSQMNLKKRKHKHKKYQCKVGGSDEGLIMGDGMGHIPEKKHKKQKRHDEDKERKRRKKEKKRRKQKNSPEHSSDIMIPSQTVYN